LETSVPGIFAAGDVRNGTKHGVAAAVGDGDAAVSLFWQYLSFESNKNRFLSIEASCQFKITEDAWSNFLDQDTNTLKVSKGFLSHLAVLTIGTTRGILHAKTEGTCFNKYVLPTINVTEIIKEDFDLDSTLIENGIDQYVFNFSTHKKK
jgi:hypothetical protein